MKEKLKMLVVMLVLLALVFALPVLAEGQDGQEAVLLDLTKLAQAVISLAAGIVSLYLVPWLRSKLTNEQLSKAKSWVQIAVYAAEKLKADEKPFSRRLIAFATASAFVFMTVPTSYAAALVQSETSVVTEQMNTMEDGLLETATNNGFEDTAAMIERNFSAGATLTDKAVSFSSIVVPVDATAGKDMQAVFTIDGKQLQFTFPAGTKWERSYRNIYDIVLGNNGLVIGGADGSGVTIEPWTDDVKGENRHVPVI